MATYYALPKKDGTPRKLGRFHVATFDDGSELTAGRRGGDLYVKQPDELKRDGYNRYREHEGELYRLIPSLYPGTTACCYKCAVLKTGEITCKTLGSCGNNQIWQRITSE